MRQKYYLIEWPESQEYMERDDCVLADNMACCVPCEVYDDAKHQSKSLEDPEEVIINDNYNL